MNQRLHEIEQVLSPSRRRFLRRSAAWGAAAAVPFAMDLQNMAYAADTSGYKALVCVFLFGGNDNSNTVVPYTTAEFNDYVAARGSATLALTQAELAPIAAASLPGRQVALPTAMSALKGLYDQGKVAIMANVGVLADPLSLTDYKNRSSSTKRFPPQLFSHSDQTNFWQIGVPQYGATTGWAGRMADRLAAAGANGGSRVAMSMSLAGNNRLQAGDTTIQYQLTTSGSVSINALRGSAANNPQGKALDAILKQARTQLFEQEYAATVGRARDADAQVQAALTALGDANASGSPANAIKTLFDPLVRPAAGGTVNRLAQQLEMAAKMIGARSTLGHGRQVFFVSMGGFDTHDTLDESHGNLLRALSDALGAFYNATKALAVENNVVSFTASDFGRGLQTNGRGSDHGWGAHHFVVGGAVKGGNVYGNWNGIREAGNLLSPFPIAKLGGPEDVGQGRLLPTTAVDQYAGVLARWFGVAASELPDVLPNIGRFSLPAVAQSFI
jgi:uncharacterized protein (DUF1501 family)